MLYAIKRCSYDFLKEFSGFSKTFTSSEDFLTPVWCSDTIWGKEAKRYYELCFYILRKKPQNGKKGKNAQNNDNNELGNFDYVPRVCGEVCAVTNSMSLI